MILTPVTHWFLTIYTESRTPFIAIGSGPTLFFDVLWVDFFGPWSGFRLLGRKFLKKSLPTALEDGGRPIIPTCLLRFWVFLTQPGPQCRTLSQIFWHCRKHSRPFWMWSYQRRRAFGNYRSESLFLWHLGMQIFRAPQAVMKGPWWFAVYKGRNFAQLYIYWYICVYIYIYI